MNIEQKRVKCAEMMGWHARDDNYNSCWWTKLSNGGALSGILIRDYHPDLPDAASLKQADELLHVLFDKEFVIAIHAVGVKKMLHYYMQHGGGKVQLELIPLNDRSVVVHGQWWNSALVNAVSKMSLKEVKNENHK